MAKKHRNSCKARNLVLTPEYLAVRAFRDKPKWIEYCEFMLNLGLKVTLYEAKVGVSKYVTVQMHGKGKFKVRFSNHKPNVHREYLKHCDFFVGPTNFDAAPVSPARAIAATLAHFGLTWGAEPSTEDFHQQIYGE